jgi:prepilin-type N-terminal cleavage/methylation domain-containing protein
VRTNSPNGFTLVELLTVIVIIGILVSLLLPAVQSARESARRTQCINNLKQIGLAMHGYHAARGHLPQPGVAPTATTSNLLSISWAFCVFPYMDLQNLYDRYNFNEWGNSANNTQVYQTAVVAGFICPSDPVGSQPILHYRCENYMPARPKPEYATGGWYGISVGPGESVARPPTDSAWDTYCPFCPRHSAICPDYPCVCCQLNPQAGAFSNGIYARPNRFDDIKDGLSNTLMAGELLPQYTVHSTLLDGGAGETNIPLTASLSHCGPFNGPYDTSPHNDAYNGQIHSAFPDNYCDAFRSVHPGIVNFVMCDGSAHSLFKFINYELYNELGTINGGEPVTVGDQDK